MELNTPLYRTDYVGETINGYSRTSGERSSIFVPPRENVFIAPATTNAIVLGNGLTRDYPEVQKLIETNSKRVSQAYKLVYACNRAVHDERIYDYYVLKHRVFLSNIPQERMSQVYLSPEVFLDYQTTCNLLPYVQYFDSGASAAYLAAFDGHKRVFLFGFDGDTGRGYRTVYDGTFPYTEENQAVSYDKWRDYLLNVMKVYSDVEFYRIQIDGQESPPEWRALSNYRDVSLREAVLLGDF
jgi:hypothetical protein